MVIFNVKGLKAAPAVLTDDKNNCVTIETADNVCEERIGAAPCPSSWADPVT